MGSSNELDDDQPDSGDVIEDLRDRLADMRRANIGMAAERDRALVRVARLEERLRFVRAEEREECRKIAKGFWLDYPFGNVGDVDLVCGLCEGIADAIQKRDSTDSDTGQPAPDALHT